MKGIASIIRQKEFSVSIWLLMALVVMAFSMVVIFYGVDAFANVAHDTFHDFRHVMGMPCH
jgi:cobalt transporter subunit CbtB